MCIFCLRNEINNDYEYDLKDLNNYLKKSKIVDFTTIKDNID